MRFIDEAIITVASGNGGRGCVSFRRERFAPRGGPDGGDGGKGGDVILKASTGKRTLYEFRFKKHLKAENGRPGQGKQKTGRRGEDLVLDIPRGTIVSNAETGEVIKDFTVPGETFVLARGGMGGRGNLRFKTSTNRAPRFSQPGTPGETLSIKLDLKLLADVGIIGLPNAGKSTLIRAMSSARPKTADYPFTTLTPNLGVVETDWGEPFMAADIPGLIEGAHKGAGLGIRFLRHIERTRILVHLIDVGSIRPEAPLEAFETINRELASYSGTLPEKPQIVALNKMDAENADKGAELFLAAMNDGDVLKISALAGTGLRELKSRIVRLLDAEEI